MFGPPYRKPVDKNSSPDRNILEPKRVKNLDYNASKSSIGVYPNEIELFPLELRPILNQEDKRKQNGYTHKSETSIKSFRCRPKFNGEQCRIPRRVTPRRCSNTPDVYRNILGPTPDESILAGLQTVIDICGLVDSCHTDSEERIPQHYETIYDSYAVPKAESVSPKVTNTALMVAQNSKNIEKKFPQEMDSSFYESPPQSPIRSRSPQQNSQNIEKKVPQEMASSFYESPPQSPIRSRSPQHTVTPSHESPPGSLDLFHSLSDITSGTNDETITIDPSSTWCKMDECCGTGGDSLPCVKVKARDGRDVCIKYKCKSIGSSLSAKCFPPVEILPCNLKCNECRVVTKGVQPTKDLDLPTRDSCSCTQLKSTPSKKNWKIGKHGRKESKAVVIQDPKADESYRFDPRFTCNKDYHDPEKKKPTNYRLRKSIPPIVQPVIGVCSEGKCGVKDKNPGNLLEVRYALVRIHVFQGYTTYEIMKSSKKKPSKMPHCVEGIFVTKRGD